MKLFKYVLKVSITVLLLCPVLQAEFPDRPIHIVVYTAPGGLIDITARKLAALMETKIKQPIVVDNKKGGGGIVALTHILQRPADGYTVFGLTSSVISKTVAARQDKKLMELQTLARVTTDYECLIVRKDSGLSSLEQIKNHAENEKQLWLGPAFGGTDHLFAMRVWKILGIEPVWIPYSSGNEALTALLGKHGQVYVGNPQDASSQPDLELVAIASPTRLKQFGNIPTFEELGFAAISDESLWRGFAVKKGTPSEVVDRLQKMVKDATEEKEWKDFLVSGNSVPAFDTGATFEAIIAEQITKDKVALSISK